MKMYKKSQPGSVSIFIVIFAALLISVITIAFVGIMIKDQEQATAADLSQSAYDSAQAGVEDAKRALLKYQNICETGGDCLAAKADIDTSSSSECNHSIQTLSDITINGDGEVDIKTGTSDSLNQAYTCVKINIDTVDYLGILAANNYELIALTGLTDFDSIKIDWFSSENISSDNNFAIDLNGEAAGSQPLLNQSNWPNNRPPIMQVQLIQYGSNGFNLSDFDSINGGGESNANTLFLYPVNTATLPSYSFTASDGRRASDIEPTPVQCLSDLSSGGYACSTTLSLPNPIGGGDRTAYLYVGSIYNDTDFKISLYKAGNLVKFGGVQPEIDSTGRANDLFRRVKVRVKMTDADFPYPTSALYVSDGICKNFIVTDDPNDYAEYCD